MEKTVLKGRDWNGYLKKPNLNNRKQEEIYVCTHNHSAIYKIRDYYFSFNIHRGYRNLPSLKRLL